MLDPTSLLARYANAGHPGGAPSGMIFRAVTVEVLGIAVGDVAAGQHLYGILCLAAHDSWAVLTFLDGHLETVLCTPYSCKSNASLTTPTNAKQSCNINNQLPTHCFLRTLNTRSVERHSDNTASQTMAPE